MARNNVIPEILVNLSNRERNTHSLTTLTGRYSTTKELCRDFGSAAVPFARKAAGRGTGVHVIQQALLYSPLTSAATPQACVLILLRAFYLSSLAVVGVALLGAPTTPNGRTTSRVTKEITAKYIHTAEKQGVYPIINFGNSRELYFGCRPPSLKTQQRRTRNKQAIWFPVEGNIISIRGISEIRNPFLTRALGPDRTNCSANSNTSERNGSVYSYFP